jgi:hypothetical protein
MFETVTAGNWISIVMHLILVSGLITLFANTNNVGKDKNCQKYYGANVATAVLIAVYLAYSALLALPEAYQFIPK